MNHLNTITAAILAGGAGTRLRAAVADRPKVLAQVNGRPFLAYLLDQLADAGIMRVVLCTGYMAECIEAAFGSTFEGMELLYSRESSALGTGGALRQALPLLDSSPLLVTNGDSFLDADLKLFAAQHAALGASASLLLAHVEDVSRYGAVTLGTNDSISGFDEKGSQGSGLINAGLYLLQPAVIESIPAGKAVSLEREVFPALIGQGLCGFSQPGAFLDIGTPADYLRAAEFFTMYHPDTPSKDRK